MATSVIEMIQAKIGNLIGTAPSVEVGINNKKQSRILL